jgi:hypothetical protein
MEQTTRKENVIPTETPKQSKTDAVIQDLRINPEWLITGLFCFFLGFLGVHRFYNGKIGTGILMILTLGGFGIWTMIDFIMVLFGRFRRKDGTLIPVRIKAV